MKMPLLIKWHRTLRQAQCERKYKQTIVRRYAQQYQPYQPFQKEHKADSFLSIKVDFTDAELCAIIAATPH